MKLEYINKDYTKAEQMGLELLFNVFHIRSSDIYSIYWQDMTMEYNVHKFVFISV